MFLWLGLVRDRLVRRGKLAVELAAELVGMLLSGLAVHASFCAASPGEGAMIGVGSMRRSVVDFESGRGLQRDGRSHRSAV